MSMEMSKLEKRDVVESSFEGKMRSLEESLQGLLDGKVVDYEKQIKSVEDQVKAMEIKHAKDERIAKFLDKFTSKIKKYWLIIPGFLALLAQEHQAAAAGMAVGGVSLSVIALGVQSKFQEQAFKISQDIKELIDESRKFTDAYLQKGGATYVEGGRLEVTKEQVEKVRGEMEKDLK